MTVPVLARVAGESFTMITGVDLAYDDLDTDKLEGLRSRPDGRRECGDGSGRGSSLAPS
jgi:hypothetical protein